MEANAPHPEITDPRHYRRFIRAALILTLTLGATWGTVNLAYIMYALGPVPPSHVQVHGQVQVFGFIYLFIVGVAYHVIPRFSGHPLRFPGLARASFLFLVGGVLARSFGQPFGFAAGGQFLLRVSALLYGLGILSFALIVVATANSPRTYAPPAGAVRRLPLKSHMEPYVLAGIFWMVVSTIYAAGEAVYLARWGLTALSGTWQRPLWFVALYGGALSWIFGIGTRVLPGFLATRPARTGLVRVGFVLLQSGVVCMILASIALFREERELARILRLLAMTGASLSILVTFAAVHGLASAPGARKLPGAAVFPRFVRDGFRWTVVSALLTLVSVGLELRFGRETHSLLQDAVRHVFTLGGLVMILFGMATRLLPVFEAVLLPWPRLATLSLHLVNIGVVLRLAQIGAAYFRPDLMAVAGASGFFALAGIAGMAAVLFRTLKGPKKSGPLEEAAASPVVQVHSN